MMGSSLGKASASLSLGITGEFDVEDYFAARIKAYSAGKAWFLISSTLLSLSSLAT